ncbi:site-specific integrase [Xenophilus azovorans]|uniref:site-specific integrase n=1 Tax=Xenophilus azovorans TaxID=151755 RepID=UPI000A814711|nr:site-specific integrase [Xenophilus azovorans]
MHRRPDTSIYQFGLRVPNDLRSRFPGPWAVRCSLKTADLREANARAKELQATWEVRFQALRNGAHAAMPGPSQPAAPDLHALRVALLERVEAALPSIDARSAGMSAEERRRQIDSAQWVLESRRAAMQGGWVDDLGADEWIEELAPARHPAAIAEVQAARVLLSELHVEALVDTSRTFPTRVRRLRERRALLALGELGGSAGATPGPAIAASPAVAVRRIGDAYDLWLQVPRPAKTAATFKRHAGMFADMMGDPALSSVDRRAALRFRVGLQDWAVEHKKTPATADNVLVSVRAIFSAARDHGWIDSTPFADLPAIKVGGAQQQAREPWTHAELAVLFDDPIWTAYQLPLSSKAGRAAAYWVPLIACFTGARVSEIAQLWTDDLTLTPGEEVIEFRASKDRGQQLKNAGSWRAVPMHSELIRLGLNDYAASLPVGPLFPDLPTAGVNGAGGQFGKWFGEFKTRKGFPGRAKAFHSFRHLVATELRLNGATEAQANAITGHAGIGVAGKVYAATIRQHANRLRDIIELLRFPELRLPRVYSVGDSGRKGQRV